ncbi:MAG: hypothetical protein AABW81_00075 [Nanoarchaeota archaeon]
MLDNKELNIIKRNIENLTKEEKIVIDKKNKGKFTNFFLENSKKSFDSAKLLMEVSLNQKLKDNLGYSNFEGYLWVINSSYYSMFYMARALLENVGIKIKSDSSTQSIHLLTFYALVYFFYMNKKLEKKLVDDFHEASEESGEILGKEKAKKLIGDYELEKQKRDIFTYEIGQIAMQNKAKTSLERAKFFNQEIKKMLGLT